MKSAKPPTPPDPVATAAAQTASNKETAQYSQALNLVDQNTPLGSLTYTQLPGSGNANDPTRWSSTVALSPEGQRSFDLQQQVSEALNKLALGSTAQVNQTMGTSQNYDGLPQPKGLDTSNLPKVSTIDLSSLPGVKGLNFSSLPQLKPLDYSSLSDLKPLDYSGLSSLKNFDTSGIAKAPTGLDLSLIGDAPVADEAARQKAQDAIYGMSTSRLDPQYDLQQKRLETQLINKGIAQGSDAWNNSLESFNRSKTDAYSTAQRSSIADAANYESTLFGMADTAYKDRFNTAQTSFADSTLARGNAISELQQSVADALANRQQGVGEQNNLTADAAARRQQGISEQQSLATDAAARRQQGIGEEQALTADADAKRQRALLEQEAQNTSSAADRARIFNEQGATNATDLTNRQQGITEANYLRELPINEISSLLNGGQVSMPSFSNTPQTSVANTNVAGIIQSNFDNQNSIYKTQQASDDALTGAVFSLAGSALGGWATGGFK